MIPTHAYDSIDSTNAEARRLIAAGRAEHKFVVIAREQSAGRGRGANTWVSPRDAGIYLSVVQTDVGQVIPELTHLTLAAGVACAEAIEKVLGLRVRLKAINDLFIGTRKLGGILTESIVEGDQLRAIITGVGINTHPAERALPAGSPTPISLTEALGCNDGIADGDQIDNERLTMEIAQRVIERHRRLLNGDWPEMRQRWEEFAGVDLNEALASAEQSDSARRLTRER